MAARPGRGPARRDGVRARLAPDPTRERGGAALHLAEVPDPDHERLLDEYDAAIDQALSSVELTFVEHDGPWAERIAAAVAHLFALATANPRQARLCTVDVFEAGQRGLERRDRTMHRFMRLCEAGYGQSGASMPTHLAPQLVAGAVFELIRSHATENRLADLPHALPSALLIVLAPIVGRDEALAVADSVTS